jgi:hypothetical protein
MDTETQKTRKIAYREDNERLRQIKTKLQKNKDDLSFLYDYTIDLIADIYGTGITKKDAEDIAGKKFTKAFEEMEASISMQIKGVDRLIKSRIRGNLIADDDQ